MAIVIVSIIMMSMGCGKEPMPSPCKLPDCSDTIKWVFKQADSLGVLPILWYKPAHAPDTSGSHQWCFATEDGVMLVNEIQDGRNNLYVRFLDRLTGEELLYWDNIKGDILSDIQYYPEANRLMVKRWSSSAVFDLKTRSEILFTKLPAHFSSTPKGTVIGDYYYTSSTVINSNPKEGMDYTSMIRTKIGDGVNWETVYTLSENEINKYTPNFYNYRLWMHPNTGDSIILINNRLYHWERFQAGENINTLERSDVIAYNLSKRKVEWTIDSICKVSQLYEQFHTIENNTFFSSNSGEGMSVINLLNGTVITKGIKAGVRVLDPAKNELIGRSPGKIQRLDKNGNFVKSFDFPDEININGMELFEDYIYFSSYYGDLYVINATTGKIVFQEFSGRMLPGRSILGMRGRASVDRKHRLLYCSDLWGTYCLKLPERWE